MNTFDKDCRKQINALFCTVIYLFMCLFFVKNGSIIFVFFGQIDILGSSVQKKIYIGHEFENIR